ncbi:MAG: anaerobic ribonucleoside-triphosphate reductase activating protein [Candidatus Berkelbacteria bacterium]
MQIAGIQKLTLVDFPGRVAATIFTRGCSFRCGFCHNPELVIPEQYSPLLDEKQLFDFLEKRYGKLTGVCITGGEPCLQPDIAKFITHLKALGFDTKLDTNGSFPESLEKIIKDGEIDYIAMDIKASLGKYAQVAIPKSELLISKQSPNTKSQKTDVIPSEVEVSRKRANSEKELIQKIQKSIKLIMNSGIDYEFRTTVCHPYHQVADFDEIGKMIKGAPRYYLQNYRESKHVDKEIDFQPFSDQELGEAQKIMQKYVAEVDIR